MGKHRSKQPVASLESQALPSTHLLLRSFAIEAASGQPDPFLQTYRSLQPHITLKFVVNMLIDVVTLAAAHQVYSPFEIIWDQFKDQLTIEHFRKKNEDRLPLSLIGLATLHNPILFTQFWKKFSASIRFKDLIEAPGGYFKDCYLFTIFQKIEKNNATPQELKSLIQSILAMCVSFNDAGLFFNTFPDQIKLPKFTPDQNTFVRIDGSIYTIENVKTHPHALLGKGGQGSAKLARDENNNFYTIKCQYGTLDTQNQDEINILNAMGKLKGIAQHNLPAPKTIESTSFTAKTYKVLPFVEGNTLYAELKTRNMTLTQKLIIAIKLCKQVDDLHQRYKTIHGDLKPANIIVKFHNDQHSISVELIDLGGAKTLPAGYAEVKKYDSFGTDGYRANEIQEYKIFSYASDVFALGVILEKDLELPCSIMSTEHLSTMRYALRAYRPLLSHVIDALVSELQKQSPLDSDILQLITAHGLPNAQASGASSAETSNVAAQAKDPLLLQLIPRTTQSSLFYGDENDCVEFDGRFWKKINSSIDFATHQNQYWVSLGSAKKRERLFFYAASETMQRLCQEFHTTFCMHSLLPPPILLNALCQFVYDMAPLSSASEFEKYQNVTLDVLIDNQELVCRHRALITIKLLTFLISMRLLPNGIVRQYRSDISTQRGGAHTVATYRNLSTNELWAIDSMNNLIYKLSSYDSNNRLYTLYGQVAMLDMKKRLDFLDIYEPFINTLLQSGLFPFIDSANYHEERRPNALPTIKIKFKKTISNSEFYSFVNALALYGVDSNLRKLPDLTLEISYISPELFAKFNMHDLSQSYQRCYDALAKTPDLHCTSAKGALIQRINRLNIAVRKKLQRAIDAGSMEQVRSIFNFFPSALHVKTKNTAFTNSCFKGKLGIVEYLVDKMNNKIRLKGLCVAAKQRKTEICHYLLQKINFRPLNFQEILSLYEDFVEYDYFDLFKSLGSAAGYMPNQLNPMAATALNCAARNGRVEFCQYLLDNFSTSISIVDIQEALTLVPDTASLVLKPLLSAHIQKRAAPAQSLKFVSESNGVQLYRYVPLFEHLNTLNNNAPAATSAPKEPSYNSGILSFRK